MNTGSNSPFFGAYNARHINAEEVASQFVSSTKFWELLKLRNSLLVGPRGSGKTHLLKMLQPKALSAWNCEDGEKARSVATFWGVFVPADVNWRAQVDQRSSDYPKALQSNFGRVVFLSHVREAFITCMLQLTRDLARDPAIGSTKLNMSRDCEVDFCKLLAEVWKINIKVPSLDGLRLALISEMSNLGDRNLTSFSPYAEHLWASNVVEVSREIVTVFESVFRIYGTRWALCFDELEIAPPSIQRELFAYLRSTDARLVFKLAISPANGESAELNNEYAASAGNDFDAIPLWFTDQREREAFCRLLWEKQAERAGNSSITPERMLARSRFQFPNEQLNVGKRRYGVGSDWARDFSELEKKDRSFSQYLIKKSIHADGLNDVTKGQRDAVIRKIAPLVGFRNSYLAPLPDRNLPIRLKILKSPPAEVFSGWDALCTATEGNPRWFCGMASKLLLKRDGSPSGIALTRDQQAKEFESAARKFLAWISAIPIERAESRNSAWSLRQLMDVLGVFFQDSVLGKQFTADPVLAFEVDDATPEEILPLLISALNIGAIVAMDESINLTLSNIVGHRFRLVHLLAPHYRIPMRNGKHRTLSSILSLSRRRFESGAQQQNAVVQQGLFND